jgi:hypothetical protein
LHNNRHSCDQPPPQTMMPSCNDPLDMPRRIQ